MTEEQRRYAYELFYLVKGHIKYFDDADLEAIVRDYTRRLWYNEEAHLYLEGFDEAYRVFSMGSYRFRQGKWVRIQTAR